MLNSLYCTLDQLIIVHSTMPQDDEAFIDGFGFFTCLTRRKESKEKGLSMKTHTLDRKNHPKLLD